MNEKDESQLNRCSSSSPCVLAARLFLVRVWWGGIRPAGGRREVGQKRTALVDAGFGGRRDGITSGVGLPSRGLGDSDSSSWPKDGKITGNSNRIEQILVSMSRNPSAMNCSEHLPRVASSRPKRPLDLAARTVVGHNNCTRMSTIIWLGRMVVGDSSNR